MALGPSVGALSPSLALAGLVDDACEVADRGLECLFEALDPPLADGAGIVVGLFLASLFGSRVADTSLMVEGLRAEALRHPADPMLSVWSLMLGRALLSRGRLGEALDLLTEARLLLRVEDPSRLLAWALGSLAQVNALSGNLEAAQAAVAEMELVPDDNLRAFGLDRELGRAWTASAEGRVDDARRITLEAAGTALRDGAHGVAAYALVEAFRLGVSATHLRSIWTVNTPLQGALLPLAVEVSTTALAPRELLDRANRLARLGAQLWAGDVAAIALRHAQLVGEPTVAVATRLWLDEHSPAEPILTPALEDARMSSRGGNLTSRERDLIRLVVAGRSNTDIATALFISRRTVESHLHNIFKKLSISSREELISAIGGISR